MRGEFDVETPAPFVDKLGHAIPFEFVAFVALIQRVEEGLAIFVAVGKPFVDAVGSGFGVDGGFPLRPFDDDGEGSFLQVEIFEGEMSQFAGTQAGVEG